MKNVSFFILFFFTSIFSLLLITGCSKTETAIITPEKPVSSPSVKTTLSSNITATTAVSGGLVSGVSSGQVISARGVCWSTGNVIPTVDLATKTVDGVGEGAFTSKITGLTQGTFYTVRAYATCSSGTVYGDGVGLSTIGLRSVKLLSCANVKGNSATAQASVTNDQNVGSVVASGVCWSKSTNPTISNFKTNTLIDSNNSIYTSLTDLSLNTVYYVRAYVTNEAGTNYSNEISFNSGYLLGASFGGGIVVNNDGSGHGLVCATSDQSTGIQWDFHSYLKSSTNEIIDGLINTNRLIQMIGEGNYAAKLCYDLILNGYDDWYLPSDYQLFTFLCKSNLLSSSNGGEYWSSNEYDLVSAESRRYDGYRQPVFYNKHTLLKVRAVRNF